MAGLFDKQAEAYAANRPKYPREWFSLLASLTPHHRLAWDAGTGSGQAALCVAEQYDQVIATDVSAAQIQHAAPHPKVRYLHTPLATSEDDLVSLVGGEGSVDLVTVATAVHWFDLPSFYSVVNRVLRKPGGVIAVWTYGLEIKPFEDVMRRLYAAAAPFMDPRPQHWMDGYRTLPFPFEGVGMGSEGKPVELEMEVKMTLDEFLAKLRTGSPIVKAMEEGVDLVSREVEKEIRERWGDAPGTRRLEYKVSMLAGTPKL